MNVSRALSKQLSENMSAVSKLPESISSAKRRKGSGIAAGFTNSSGACGHSARSCNSAQQKSHVFRCPATRPSSSVSSPNSRYDSNVAEEGQLACLQNKVVFTVFIYLPLRGSHPFSLLHGNHGSKTTRKAPLINRVARRRARARTRAATAPPCVGASVVQRK